MPESTRVCGVCGVDISHRQGSAIRCAPCKRRPILTAEELTRRCERCSESFQMIRRGRHRRFCPPCSVARGTDPIDRGACEGPECVRPVKYRKLCSGHGEQRRLGKPLTPLKLWAYGPHTRCGFGGCRKKVRANGYCWGHDEQRASGRPLVALRSRQPTNSSSVRDELGRKRCYGCRQWREVKHFSVGTKGDMLASSCRDCTRSRRLERVYNITQARYEAMLAEQAGGCAICSMPPTAARMLSVDHDHSCCPDTNRSCGACVRGLLCGPCNTAIGLLQEAPARLAAALRYVERGASVRRVAS